jgi:hypothetical protein
MDFPNAPRQLSQFLGMCITANALGLDVVPQLLEEGDIGAEVSSGHISVEHFTRETLVQR